MLVKFFKLLALFYSLPVKIEVFEVMSLFGYFPN